MRERESGSLLIVTIVVAFVLVGIAVAWSQFAVLTYREAVRQEAEERAFHVAEAGADFIVRLLNTKQYSLGELSGATIVQNKSDGTFAVDVGGNLSVTGYYGAHCQTINVGLGSYSGGLGGPYYYTGGLDHDKGSSINCGPIPEEYIPSPYENKEEFTYEGPGTENLQTYAPVYWQKISGAKDLVIDGALDTVASDCQVSDETAFYKAAYSETNADYEVSVVVAEDNSATSIFTLAARVSDDNQNYYLASANAGGIVITKWINGNQVIDGGFTSGAYGINDIIQGSVVTLKVDGNTISVLVNGVEYASLVDADNPITEAGSAGLGIRCRNCGQPGFPPCVTTQLDNFEINPI